MQVQLRPRDAGVRGALGSGLKLGRSACMEHILCRQPRSRPLALRATVAVASDATKVVVMGAAGRTGSLVLGKLLARPEEFVAKGVVRSERSADKAAKLVPGAAAQSFVRADVCDKQSLAAALAAEAGGYDAMVLLTSAVPKLKLLSLVPVLLSKLVPGMEARRPDFYFPEGASPREVDYDGAVNQIDAAKAAGIKRIVFVGSMGGTQVDNFLNTMGQANILLWKRKAEMYLVASGLEYTIIHPGGLKDTEGGKRELIVDVDDKILDGDKANRGIPRSDVAELVVQCLKLPQASNRSFDVSSYEEGTGTVTTDFAALITSLDGKNCDYSLPKSSPVPLP
eukprot:CAMPEP_0114259622 /NCGR_PEP_ID=MMETSP0058-20121206/19992_1 /TAXON_ID=36894 /ORGANISM="Pyramimonas parkeae, CCMP726" /LENGTH=338 /DNA_ID=CAMNT_0001374683 /DNA_START=79 /DNA_END=1095 /DNA_ORIENTATION=+